MKNKEEMESLLTNEWQSLHFFTKALHIQHYQAKMIMDKLIAEGKAESCQFNKRIKYRKKISLIN